MAGFTTNWLNQREFEFHIDTPNVVEMIRQAQFNPNARSITLQLDGDELDAALWGLDNYNKQKSQQTIVNSSK